MWRTRRGNMILLFHQAARWGLLAAGLVFLFWGIWSLTVAPVPHVGEKLAYDYFPPFLHPIIPYLTSRWLDPVWAFSLVFVLVLLWPTKCRSITFDEIPFLFLGRVLSLCIVMAVLLILCPILSKIQSSLPPLPWLPILIIQASTVVLYLFLASFLSLPLSSLIGDPVEPDILPALIAEIPRWSAWKEHHPFLGPFFPLLISLGGILIAINTAIFSWTGWMSVFYESIVLLLLLLLLSFLLTISFLPVIMNPAIKSLSKGSRRLWAWLNPA